MITLTISYTLKRWKRTWCWRSPRSISITVFIFLTITLATILITNFLKCHIKGGGGPGGGEVQDQAGLRRPQRCLWWAHVIGERNHLILEKNKLLYESYSWSSQNIKAGFSSFGLQPLADSILYYVWRPVSKHLTIPISCNSFWNTSCFYQLNTNYMSYINILNPQFQSLVMH